MGCAGRLKLDQLHDAQPAVFSVSGGCEVPSDRIFAGGRASRRQQQGYEFDHGLSFVAPAQAELKGAVEAQAELAAAGEGTTFICYIVATRTLKIPTAQRLVVQEHVP